MELNKIQQHIDIINDLLDWNAQYGKGTFSPSDLHRERRRLKILKKSAEGKCCAAAYGISQVGKSYLMGSLLSSNGEPFSVSIGGKDYDFITSINPSGGNTGKTESTGVITRFTTDIDTQTGNGLIKLTLLSPIDIVLMLVDAYYNDVKRSTEQIYNSPEKINEKVVALEHIWSNCAFNQSFIEEDDIKDMADYLKDVLSVKVQNILASKFFDIISQHIKHVTPQNWKEIFSILWNDNKDINFLFYNLIQEHEKLGFAEVVYVPMEAILSTYGTLLDVTLLDKVCGKENGIQYAKETTDILNEKGQIITNSFSKYYLAALISEITLQLPTHIVEETDKAFLKQLDLLDFPGARSRKEIPEETINSDELAEILRRGKVAYLFNKYSRSLKIGTILFCHDHDQCEVSSVGSSIDGWIKEYVAGTAAERTRVLQTTGGISPIFFVGTKFNMELKPTDTDRRADLSEQEDASILLDSHWNRFNKNISGVIQPGRWMDDWVTEGSAFRSRYFQSIYLLRDYNYSRDFFDGYDEHNHTPEIAFKNPSNFPNYYDCLKASFLRNEFVKKHFTNPEQAWNEVATANNDGSSAIIRDLNKIAPLLENAREQKYLSELRTMQQRLINILEANYILDTDDGRNEKLRKIVNSLLFRLDLTIGKNPEQFGCIIDDLMVKPRDIYSIAYDIIVLRRKMPKNFSQIGFIRQRAGIQTNDSEGVRLKKLCELYQVSENELVELLRADNLTIDDVISTEIENESTQASIIVKQVLESWTEHINSTMQKYIKVFPYTDEFANMLITNFKMMGMRQKLVDKIQWYQECFEQEASINAIADYVSLVLNNFVSTIGYTTHNSGALTAIQNKALMCNLNLQVDSPAATKECTLNEALQALEDSKRIQLGTCPTETLNSLPFWANYQQWLKYLIAGFIYAENIVVCDKEANDKIKNMLELCQKLY